VFLCGEHDAAIDRDIVAKVIERHLRGKRIVVGETWHDAVSDSLVVHGHQFDYNRIFWNGDVRVSCVDGLTHAINAFLSDIPETERRIREAVGRGVFSYWYAYGQLPGFISAVAMIFGADIGTYQRECARVLRGGDLDRWLAQQSSLLTHTCGTIAKLVALYPPLLLGLYEVFYALLDLHVKWKMRQVLIGRSYRDQPEILKVNGGVLNLITGHFHDPRIWHWQGRSCYSIGCPRLSIAGIRKNNLQVFRDLDFVLLDGRNVSFHHERISRGIPLSEFGIASPEY